VVNTSRRPRRSTRRPRRAAIACARRGPTAPTAGPWTPAPRGQRRSCGSRPRERWLAAPSRSPRLCRYAAGAPPRAGVRGCPARRAAGPPRAQGHRGLGVVADPPGATVAHRRQGPAASRAGQPAGGQVGLARARSTISIIDRSSRHSARAWSTPALHRQGPIRVGDPGHQGASTMDTRFVSAAAISAIRRAISSSRVSRRSRVPHTRRSASAVCPRSNRHELGVERQWLRSRQRIVLEFTLLDESRREAPQ
jgi:hypothetical protein